jgi:hypothetical protein
MLHIKYANNAKVIWRDLISRNYTMWNLHNGKFRYYDFNRASESGRGTTMTQFGKGRDYGDLKEQRPWSEQDS